MMESPVVYPFHKSYNLVFDGYRDLLPGITLTNTGCQNTLNKPPPNYGKVNSTHEGLKQRAGTPGGRKQRRIWKLVIEWYKRIKFEGNLKKEGWKKP